MEPKLRLLFAALALGSCAAPPLERFEFTEAHMGTEFRLVFYAEGPDVAEPAARAAFDRVAALDAALSDYREDSELSRLGRASEAGALPAAVEVSADLARVLALALEVGAASDGAFDPALGALTRLWRRSVRQGELPRPARLEAARAAAGRQHFELRTRADAAGAEVVLHARGLRFDLGGVAKGDALDQALAALRAHGVERALVDGGGDLLAGAPPPDEVGWKVAYAGLGNGRLRLAHAALATSGDLYQSVEIDGVRYSHLIDPRTGLGLTTRVAATVLAPDGARADAWASALCVLGPAGLARLAAHPGVEARVARLGADGAAAEERTAGFPPDW
jgi:thiamine biosynthesis lipoprotein